MINNTLKHNNTHRLINKIFALYLLNISDIIFTLELLKSGYYKEANSLIVPLLTNIHALILAKIVLPAFLLSFIALRLKNATKEQLIVSNVLINAITFIYILINISHVLGSLLCLYLKS